MDRDTLRTAATPEAIKEAIETHGDELIAGADHHHGGFSSVRSATHKGHEIVVLTTYEITVDDKRFDAPLTVDNSGRVHYHGLPTRDFTSAIALVKTAIDTFPEDFSSHHEHGRQTDSDRGALG